MGRQWMAGNSVRETYDSYAPVFDDFNHGYMYERWTGRLLKKAEEAGAGGDKRLLDVACGTGLSALPMLERGWTVTGCDISPGMLEVAREKVGGKAELIEADMRELPELGQFDLIWAVNDPLNYLLDNRELEATFDGMRRNLSTDGIVLFDTNTLVTYRTFFSNEVVVEEAGRRLVWRGQESPAEVTAGMLAEAHFETSDQSGLDHVHRQRHFSEEEVLLALRSAGLECVALYGELDGELTFGLDENHHTKAVYVCRLL